MLKKNLSGTTPLEDTTGLIPRHISTKEELDELEFANINRAMRKYFLGKPGSQKAPFDVSWLLKLHKEMYGQVWKWAGKPRTTGLNIGVAPERILEGLKQLMDNFRYWENETTMELLEKTARLHHGLVKIHPFKNGNGRWARLVANVYLRQKGGALIQWPESTLQVDSLFRKEYIQVLRQADQGDYDCLIAIHQKLAKS